MEGRGKGQERNGTKMRKNEMGGKETSLAWPPPHKVLDPPPALALVHATGACRGYIPDLFLCGDRVDRRDGDRAIVLMSDEQQSTKLFTP